MLNPPRTPAVSRAILVGAAGLMLMGAAPPMPPQGAPPPTAAVAAGWDSVQALDNRTGVYPLDEPTVTRAGTSVITWVGGAIWRGDVYTSVRRPEDPEWSSRQKVHGKFAIEHVEGLRPGRTTLCCSYLDAPKMAVVSTR